MKRYSNLDLFEITSQLLIYCLPFVGILGLIIPLLIHQMNLAIIGIFISIPLIISPIIYYLLKNRVPQLIIVPKRLYSRSLIVYSIFFVLATITLFILPVRPFFLYGILGLMSVIIAFDILTFELNPRRIILNLIMTITLFFIEVWGINLKYYFYIARTDPIVHAYITNSIVKTGHISSIFQDYNVYAFWHIYTAITSIITEAPLPIYKVTFILNGFVYAMLIIFCYLITRYFFDKRISLLSSLLLAVNSRFIINAQGSIPRYIVSFFGIIIFYLFLKKLNKSNLILVLFLYPAMIFTHHVSIILIICIFILLWLLQFIYNDHINNIIKFSHIIILGLVFIIYLLFNSENVLSIIITSLFRQTQVRPLNFYASFPLSELANNLHHSPLIVFGIIGSIFLLQDNKYNHTCKIIGLFGLILLGVSLPGPSFIINNMATQFGLSRLEEYTFLFTTIITSYGFYIIYTKAPRRGKLIMLMLMFLVTFFSISNDYVASDNPLVKRQFYTFYLNRMEIHVMNTIPLFTEGRVMSDYVTIRYLNTVNKTKSHILEVNAMESKLLQDNKKDVIMIRSSELKIRPLSIYVSKDGLFKNNPSWGNRLQYFDADNPIWKSILKKNQVYNCKGILVYN